MSVMCSVAKAKDVVVFILDIAENGDPLFKISWYKGKKWETAEFRHFEDAYQTWKLVSNMI